MWNQTKTFLLLATLSAVLLAAGEAVAGRTGLLIALLLALGLDVAAYWFSDRVVLRMYGARELAPHQAPGIFSLVDGLAALAGIPMPRVYIIPELAPNAFATGRNPNNASIALTEGLLLLLTRDELSAVIAQELAHIQHRDTLILSIAVAFGPLGQLIVPMVSSRSREFLADETAAHIARDPIALVDALRKLESSRERAPMSHEKPGAAHLFIINPFKAAARTHPSTEDRVARLRMLAGSPTYV